MPGVGTVGWINIPALGDKVRKVIWGKVSDWIKGKGIWEKEKDSTREKDNGRYHMVTTKRARLSTSIKSMGFW